MPQLSLTQRLVGLRFLAALYLLFTWHQCWHQCGYKTVGKAIQRFHVALPSDGFRAMVYNNKTILEISGDNAEPVLTVMLPDED